MALPRPLKPGDPLPAEWLNSLLAEVKKLSNIRGAGGIEVSNMSGGITLRGLDAAIDTYIGTVDADTDPLASGAPGEGTLNLLKQDSNGNLVDASREKTFFNPVEELLPADTRIAAFKNPLDGKLYALDLRTDTFIGVVVLPIGALTDDGVTVTPGSGSITLQELNGSGELVNSSRTEGVYNLTEETIPNGYRVTATRNPLDGNLYITHWDRPVKRGVLDATLSATAGASATMSVYTWNVVSEAWEDSDEDITVYAAVPILVSIASGTAVKAYLHHTKWFVDTAECVAS